MSNPSLLIIGDSHCLIWEGNTLTEPFYNSQYKNIKSIHLGPALAYNLIDKNGSDLGKWGMQVINAVNNQIQINPHIQGIILTFGEIDIRTQVIKRAINNNCIIDSIINILVTRIHKFAEILHELFPVPILIWEPVPTTSSSAFIYNSNFPTVGTELERNFATEKFSQQSRKNNFININNKKIISFGISEKLINDYLTDASYYSDGCHLNKKGLQLTIESLHKVEKEWGLMSFSSFFSFTPKIDINIKIRNISSLVKLKLSSTILEQGSLLNLNNKYCFHTNYENKPYILIDIGYAANIVKLRIFNRFDSFHERAKFLSISIGIDQNDLRII